MTEKPYYSVNETAEYLTVHPRTVHKWLADGKLERVKAGRRVLIPKESIDAFIEASTHSNSDKTYSKN